MLKIKLLNCRKEGDRILSMHIDLTAQDKNKLNFNVQIKYKPLNLPVTINSTTYIKIKT